MTFHNKRPKGGLKSRKTNVFYFFVDDNVVLDDEDDEVTSVDFNEDEVLQRCQDFQKDYEKRKNLSSQPIPPSRPVPKPRQFISGRPLTDSSSPKTQQNPKATTVSWGKKLQCFFIKICRGSFVEFSDSETSVKKVVEFGSKLK